MGILAPFTLDRARQRGQLLTECDILERDGPMSAAEQSDRSEEHDQHRQHGLIVLCLRPKIKRWDTRSRIGEAQATAAAFAAAIWFAFRPPSPELHVEATVLVVMGSMLAAATAKLRSLIQHNTRLVLQALAAARPESDSASSLEKKSEF
jgi:hypothetical protein